MLDLSGKHSNLAILEGNRDVIQSKQSPWQRYQRTPGKEENKKGSPFYENSIFLLL